VFGISTDDRDTLKRFKEKLGAPHAFLSDPDGHVSRQYTGVIPVVKMANRANVVVGADGIVKELVTGGDAIDPSSAIAACPAAGAGS
jgi:thioredoxin-dependent peroxiredoxin